MPMRSEIEPSGRWKDELLAAPAQITVVDDESEVPAEIRSRARDATTPATLVVDE